MVNGCVLCGEHAISVCNASGLTDMRELRLHMSNSCLKQCPCYLQRLLWRDTSPSMPVPSIDMGQDWLLTREVLTVMQRSRTG